MRRCALVQEKGHQPRGRNPGSGSCACWCICRRQHACCAKPAPDGQTPRPQGRPLSGCNLPALVVATRCVCPLQKLEQSKLLFSRHHARMIQNRPEILPGYTTMSAHIVWHDILVWLQRRLASTLHRCTCANACRCFPGCWDLCAAVVDLTIA